MRLSQKIDIAMVIFPTCESDFPGGSDGKGSAYNARDLGLIPPWGNQESDMTERLHLQVRKLKLGLRDIYLANCQSGHRSSGTEICLSACLSDYIFYTLSILLHCVVRNALPNLSSQRLRHQIRHII